MISDEDRIFMAEAIQLANKGLYTTDPNPRVGCLIVNAGRVVGRGWHVKAGEGHAEVNALHEAGVLAEGATVYVTLEPCSHFGKTPPCADALTAAKVSRVVAAMEDPNPLVAGRGFKRLQEAGIEVDFGLLQSEAEALNPGFIKRMKHGYPLVRIKLAMSADGRTAMASGESQWITGPDARQDVQRLRARSSAVVTGAGTVSVDDPSLTVRAHELGLDNAAMVAEKQPWRVVVSSSNTDFSSAKLLRLPGKVVLVSASDNPVDLSSVSGVSDVEQWVCAGDDGQVDLKSLLHELALKGCNEVLVEAGATLAGGFVSAGLADELWVYMASKLLGSNARPLLEMPLDKMSEQVPLSIKDIRAVGEDIRIIYKLDSDVESYLKGQ